MAGRNSSACAVCGACEPYAWHPRQNLCTGNEMNVCSIFCRAVEGSRSRIACIFEDMQAQVRISSSEKAFKEKYVSIYEDIFSGRSPIQTARDKGIQGRTALARFWDELLLLKVNQEFLAQCISSKTEEELKQGVKPIVNEMFAACVTYLSDGNFIRVAHALETLAILLREVFRKRFSQQGFIVTTLVAGSVDNADNFFKRLITGVAALLTRDDVPVLVKSLGLRLYLTILTATDNVNSNPIVSYFFSNNILEPLLCVLSIKLTADRKRLEPDAVLVLLLLLLWRESENVYVSRLSSPTAPLLPLLNTVTSLFSTSSTMTKATVVPDSTPGWEDMVGYISSLLGFVSSPPNTSTSGSTTEVSDVLWCNRACGLTLLYFLVYLNPAFKSNQTWPAVVHYVPDQGAVGQSLSAIWTSVFKSFVVLCKEEFVHVTSSETARISQAKLALTVLRCMLENPVAADYLSYCDPDFSLRKASENGVVGSAYVPPSKSISCVIVDLAVDILRGPLNDPDLFYRAAVLISLVLRNVKAQGWQLSSSSVNSAGLWQALINCCEGCGNEGTFQKPGVAELAELVAGILEWSLAVSQDIFVSTEETETLHATVLCSIAALEQLMEVASSSPSVTTTGNSQNKNWGQLANVLAVKYHYEVQIAALRVRGRPTFQQALAGVRKKGLANLKLKPKHAGPGRLYIEGTTEMRLLNSLLRLVVNVQRKQMYIIPKLEHEAV